jgi:hypothetical protein
MTWLPPTLDWWSRDLQGVFLVNLQQYRANEQIF